MALPQDFYQKLYSGLLEEKFIIQDIVCSFSSYNDYTAVVHAESALMKLKSRVDSLNKALVERYGALEVIKQKALYGIDESGGTCNYDGPFKPSKMNIGGE